MTTARCRRPRRDARPVCASSRPQLQLIADRGAAAVSLEDVEREAGVGRSQLYHYFDGRDDLLRAVIDITTEAVLGAQNGLLDQLDSFAAIDRWFDALVTLQQERGAAGGCPIGSLVGQLAERDEQTRAALATGFERWERPLIAGLTRMQDRGDLQRGCVGSGAGRHHDGGDPGRSAPDPGSP